ELARAARKDVTKEQMVMLFEREIIESVGKIEEFCILCVELRVNIKNDYISELSNYGVIGDLDNSTSNVLIPLDSWTSGLLVYKLSLSVEYGVSTSIGYGVSSFLSNIAYSSHQINTAYPLSLDTCMIRSSTNGLFTPYKESEREFRSSRRHFKTLSLDELRSPDFNLLSDQEYSEEED
ncbi:hypothetical protein Tco_1357446, partial [Tanacetum coccineum]